MFDAANLLFLFAESALHAGIGRGVSGIDLPIQRERTTQYPMVQASGVKGCLRAEADKEAQKTTNAKVTKDDVKVLFGPDDKNAKDHAGALAFGDARLLLFPIRSLAGVVAWATSLDVLARFGRDASIAKIAVPWSLDKVSEPESEQVWVHPTESVIEIRDDTTGTVVLEEFAFASTGKDLVKEVGDWIIQNALPQTTEYEYWRTHLPKKLCILPQDAFRDFVRFATEIQTHVKLNPDTKTVDGGGLWTTESLPVDSLLYSPVMATPARKPGSIYTADVVLTTLTGLALTRVQLGGEETTGQGIMAVRFAGGAE